MSRIGEPPTVTSEQPWMLLLASVSTPATGSPVLVLNVTRTSHGPRRMYRWISLAPAPGWNSGFGGGSPGPRMGQDPKSLLPPLTAIVFVTGTLSPAIVTVARIVSPLALYTTTFS